MADAVFRSEEGGCQTRADLEDAVVPRIGDELSVRSEVPKRARVPELRREGGSSVPARVSRFRRSENHVPSGVFDDMPRVVDLKPAFRFRSKRSVRFRDFESFSRS